MKEITGITEAREQTLIFRDENGEQIRLTLRYSAVAKKWFIDLFHKGFSLYNYRIVKSLNTIWTYSQVLGFGFLLSVNDGYEPFLINDFSGGRCVLYLLSKSECGEMENV